MTQYSTKIFILGDRDNLFALTPGVQMLKIYTTERMLMSTYSVIAVCSGLVTLLERDYSFFYVNILSIITTPHNKSILYFTLIFRSGSQNQQLLVFDVMLCKLDFVCQSAKHKTETKVRVSVF